MEPNYEKRINYQKYKPLLLFIMGLVLGHQIASTNRPLELDSPAVDGYVFATKEFERKHLTVDVETYTEDRQLSSDYKKATGEQSDTIAAFTVFTPDGCVIHIIDPSVRYEPEYVGHEFLHCVYGQWHNSNESNGVRPI